MAGRPGLTRPGTVIEAAGSDFYGITNSTTTAIPIVVNLQGVAAANNNPNFQFRLVTAYNSNLPLITDGNSFDPTVHGQYATGVAGPVNAQQNFQFNSGITGRIGPADLQRHDRQLHIHRECRQSHCKHECRADDIGRRRQLQRRSDELHKQRRKQ